MILDDTLLQSPAEWRTEGDSYVFQTTQTPWTATLTATAIDQIGCRLWAVKTSRVEAPPEPVDLQATAERLASRVTSLLEPLRFIEADSDRGLALVRSQEPTARQDQNYYSELLLHRDGGVELRRYQAASPGQRRQQVAFSLTHEAIVKLLDDLTR
jgi:hypothetical protein